MQCFKNFLYGLTVIFISHVHAAEFNHIDMTNSKINFSYKQMGVTMEGHFKKFSAQLKFDPDKLNLALAHIDIDLNSVDTGSTEADAEIRERQWFNSKVFPTATFRSSKIKLLAPNQYQVLGKLTIKGHSQDIVVPMTFTPHDKTASLDGTFTIKRADFAIGEGAWADFGTIANEVLVKFHMLAASHK